MSFRNINVLLTANSTSLRSQLNTAAREVDKFGAQVEARNRGIISSSKLMAAGVAGAAVTVSAAMAAAAIGAAALEQRMRNVNSISGLSEGALASLTGEVIKLSTALPNSANDLAEGLYEIASSGFQGAEGLRVLEAAGTAASAGMSTTANAAQAITATLNAYGRGAEDAQDVSDALFQTVNLGVISFNDLTGVIGDVAGAAAAAGVSINEVGAAIAAMTLSGVGGAEAGTSLNQLIAKIVQPSEALAALYGQLGYASGEAALATDGLRGVMEKLREATGGNITTLLELFPEIRAARGAMALMGAEGANYAKTSDAITNAEKRRGATLKAFNEQSKAVSFQWKIFKNEAMAVGLAVGATLLPAVLDAMNALRTFGRETGDVLDRLQPFFSGIAEIGADLVTIISHMAAAVDPLARALAKVVGGGLITSLNLLGDSLSAMTGFLADNELAAAGLAGVVGVMLVPSLLAATRAIGTKLWLAMAWSLYGVATAAGAAATGVAALATVAGAATLGLGAVIAAAVLMYRSFREHSQDGRDAMKEFAAEIPKTNRISTIAAEVGRLNDELERQRKIESDKDGTWVPFFNENGRAEAAAAIDDLEKRIEELGEKGLQISSNLHELQQETGLTISQLASIADGAQVDLAVTGAEAVAAREAVVGAIKDMERQAGQSAEYLAKTVGGDIEAMQQLAEAIDEAKKAASAAFLGDTDVLGFSFDDGAQAQDAVDRARKAKKDAEEDLADLQARQSRSRRLTAEDDRELARAREKVAEATREVNRAENARPGSKGDQLADFYEESIAKAEKFVAHIEEVTRRGLDPELVARLLQAGPEKAGPILEAMVGDHSGRLIEMANKSEEQLRAINLKVVAFARLTTRATMHATDELVAHLGTAMAITAEAMKQGASATAESVAKALGRPTQDVIDVARLYGITIGQAIFDGVASVAPPAIYVGKAGEAARNAKLDRLDGRAAGGLILGAGSGTSDSIPARLSHGEYVIRAAAVRKHGRGTFDRLNRGYASGGLVHGSERPVTGTAPPTGSQNHYTTVHQYQFNGPIQGVRLEDAERYAQRKRRQAALVGGNAP